MSQDKGITLKQLAQVALGGPSFGFTNISLLHTIIDLALKKLGCENEKVTITGALAENLQKLLLHSKGGPALVMNDIQLPMEPYKKIAQLEEKVKQIESTLDNHLAEVKIPLTKGAKTASQPCLMTCEVEEQKDSTINALLKSEFLVRELREYLSKPMVCRMNRSDIKLKKISEDIVDFKRDCFNAIMQLNEIDNISATLPKLRGDIDEQPSKFEIQLQEIRCKIDNKANSSDVLPIKEYFYDRLDKIAESLKNEFEYKLKPRALASFTDPLRKSVNFDWLKLYEEENELQQESKTSLCHCSSFPSIYNANISGVVNRFSTHSKAIDYIEAISKQQPILKRARRSISSRKDSYSDNF